MSNAPYWKPDPCHRETHREYVERRDICGSEYSGADLRDELARIDEAARHVGTIAASILRGRTPEQARADAYERFGGELAA